MGLNSCSAGHQNQLGAKFCQHCGEQLEVRLSGQEDRVFSETGFEELLTGTRLRDRYCIIRSLGQGGFGRTYLAEDTGRFREKVVLKEFFPTVQGTQALQKAEELFQREATTLHKLRHPQIPRFEEIFRESKRLFIVQEFIEGQTYQSLLEQRVRQGQHFTESEILKLFRDLLPVLSYLHQQGIIHRDISPDNMILRLNDQLPVLIDLGAIKEAAISAVTQVNGSRNSTATSLGKIGYAPDEQIRLGLVAPHSDLFALAVTALVLMTGKEPQQLLNQNTLHWQWHRELTLSAVLEKVLSRMLHRQPSQRFQSADEVLQLLNSSASNRTYMATKPTEVNIGSSRQNIPNTITNTVNSNGQRSTSGSSIQVPDEIKGWNWGAFLMSPLWPFTNRVWIGLLAWVPYVGWIMLFVLGAKGNEWAWKSRK